MTTEFVADPLETATKEADEPPPVAVITYAKGAVVDTDIPDPAETVVTICPGPMGPALRSDGRNIAEANNKTLLIQR